MRTTQRAAAALALMACCLGAAGCLFRAAKDEPPIAGEVRVEGNHDVTEDVLTARLALTRSGRWFFGLTGPHPYDPEGLPADIKRLERIYQSLGYYAARVKDVRVNEHGGRVDVTFVVEEGPPTKVLHRTLNGLEGLAPAVRRDVEEDLPLKPGVNLEEAEYDRLKVLVRERLRGNGYIGAQVDGKAVVDKPKASADVTLDVNPGDQMRLGRVFVSGAQGLSRDRVIMQSGLSPGQLITPARLAEAQKQVYAMGVFTLVQVEPAAAEAKGVAPVVITVHEAPFILREVGLGIETDPTRLIGQVRGSITHKNLARGLQQLTVGASAGWAVLPGLGSLVLGDPLQRHGPVATLRTEYVQPRILRSVFDFSTALDYQKDVNAAFDFQRIGGRISFPAHLDFLLPTLTFTPSVGYDRYFDVTQGDTLAVGVAQALTTSGCGPGTTTGGTITAPPKACTIGYLETRLTVDRRDDPISAHSGWYAAISAQYAGLPGSEFTYIRFSPEVRGYLPITERTTLAARLRYGQLRQVGCDPKSKIPGRDTCVNRDLPGVAKFFAGGANSVRVMGAQQIGPRDFLVQNNPDANKAGHDPFIAGPPLPLGGNRLLEGSVELRLPTKIEELGIVLFADAGAVSETAGPRDEDRWPTTLYLRYDVGIGIRYRTPVGPIRLDFAQRLQPWNDQPQNVRTAFSKKSDVAAFNEFSERPDVRTRPNDSLASEYRISTNCKAAGYPTDTTDPGFATQFHKCYEEGGYLWGFQFFLTIGEAF